MNMRAEDLYEIYDITIFDEEVANVKDIRKKYFVAACVHFDPTIKPEIALKLRPYGGLIGIENSSLDKYLKSSKVLRLHAILHDAAGFVKERNDSGPGYCYNMTSCPINCCFFGHVTGIIFCTFVKVFKSELFSLMKC